MVCVQHLGHVGPAVVTIVRNVREESQKTSFPPPLTVIYIFLLPQGALCRVIYFRVFFRTELAFPFTADSLSRSVHCAPDENDRPSEWTKIF